jgi:hypothetical protein
MYFLNRLSTLRPSSEMLDQIDCWASNRSITFTEPELLKDTQCTHVMLIIMSHMCSDKRYIQRSSYSGHTPVPDVFPGICSRYRGISNSK